MKAPLLFILAVSLAVFPAGAHAKGKPKGKGNPPAPAPASAENPTEALAPYINNIDGLLALERTGGPKLQLLYKQAPGRLAALRAQFSARRDSAPEPEKARFAAAEKTTERLISALDERQKVLGDISTSQAVRGSGKLEEGPRKDNLTQGIHGGSTAKAVGAIVERDREKGAQHKANVRAAQTDNALSAMSMNRWNQRSIELRKQITSAYSEIK